MVLKYMDNVKDYKYFINNIIENIEFCLRHLDRISLEDFNRDEVLSSAISFKFIQISEYVKKLPNTIFDAYPNIPWHKISGLRNRIVHDYGSIQMEIIYYTVKDDLAELLNSLNDILVI
ncbi:MAG: DUF86 domain-containing protein [Bacilli bacterium]